ncbi:MAG: flavodoxin family protein [Acidaminococcaceae bacterium]
MKKILIISTSLRRDGNSEMLADEFQRGAVESGHNVEKVCLYDKNIGFCKGCLVCQTTKNCVINDDANMILGKMLHADVLVFATPIYFYEMCGQMKTLLDRSNPLFPAKYSFRDIYLLAASADTNLASMDGAVKGLEGWIDCFEQTRLAGVVRGVGATQLGDIRNSPSALLEAYKMGKNV